MRERHWSNFLFILVAMLMIVFLNPNPTTVAQESRFGALFINVGKADAILLMLDDERYLVDTGSKDSYTHMESVLKLYGVTNLDGVFITHTDKDHVGGLKELLKSDIGVEVVYAPRFHNEKSDEKHDAYKQANKRDVPFEWLDAGMTIQSGECVFEVLGPLERDAETDNNNSLVMNLKTPDGNILLAGDMEIEEETQLLMAGLVPQATVLKVAHHGGDDSTSAAFVAAVKPQWAVISTSTAEREETPAENVLVTLWHAKAGVAVTQDAQIGILVTLKDGNAEVQMINPK
ncbi:MAG: MBL fold metallo-hydrolase [Clostridiales bacterium]|nr:MBL fold metallo-hydrolase [Clostridiales bacterium]